MSRTYFVLMFLVLLLAGSANAGYIVATDYQGPGDPNHVGYLESLDSWWWDGGAPLGPTTPNDDCDVFPDKNHDVKSFTETVASTALVSTYMRKLTALDLYGWVTGGAPSYGAVFGEFELGEYQDLTGATDHYFPPETTGQPLHIRGDVPSGLIFKDVKDEMLVQFFSSDKNDGWVEVLVDGAVVARYDTWCQGWWYFQIKDLDPLTAPHTVELRTWWNAADNLAVPSVHFNTLDLNPTSENWLHKMPASATDRDYPWPDDFHIFFVAYNHIVPEPATLMLVALGGIGAALARRKRSGK